MLKFSILASYTAEYMAKPVRRSKFLNLLVHVRSSTRSTKFSTTTTAVAKSSSIHTTRVQL